MQIKIEIVFLKEIFLLFFLLWEGTDSFNIKKNLVCRL